MSDITQLEAEKRENFGKGAARKLRAAGRTPAVVYGHGGDPVHISVDAHALGLIVRHKNALIEIVGNGKKTLALVKDVQKDPVRQIIEHVDLLVVKKGETVDVEVPVHVEGEPFPGTNALQVLNTVEVSAAASAIPESVSVSVEGLEDGAQILAGAIELPKGSTLITDPEALIVHVVTPRGETEDEAETEEGAEAAAEGEGE